jgi:hypothetical protein
METQKVPIYFLEYKDKILSLVVYLDNNFDFYYEFERNFNDIVAKLFYEKFLLTVTGQNHDGIVKSDFKPILPDDYELVLCTFVKKYKNSIRTVVFGSDEEKIVYYNNRINSDAYMRDLKIQKKLNSFIVKDNNSYYWGLTNCEDSSGDIRDKDKIWNSV